MTPPVYVGGVGFWAPGFRDASAWANGVADPPVVEPRAALLSGPIRRRATALSRMVAEVAEQAAVAARADIAEATFVLGSALGEVAAAVEIIDSFRLECGLPSPTRFHNSVHNTAVAYLSIAAGNRKGATAISAGAATVAVAFLEAAALLAAGAGSALVVLADEALPAPLASWGSYPGAAAAFHLTASPSAWSRFRLVGLQPAAPVPPQVPEPWRGHPCAWGLGLAAALQSGSAGRHALGRWGDGGWAVDVEALAP